MTLPLMYSKYWEQKRIQADIAGALSYVGLFFMHIENGYRKVVSSVNIQELSLAKVDKHSV